MSGPAFTVVPTEPDHLSEVAAIERICFSQPWSNLGLMRAISARDSVFLSAIDAQGRIAGYAGMMTVLDEGYITNVAVRPDCRRQGVAQMLLRRMEDEARRRGLSFISLEVRVSNHGAIALYSGEGYVDMGLRRGYYDLPKEDARIMTRWLK
jgi:ribosomal-protein-alanine N-acetyltransferase